MLIIKIIITVTGISNYGKVWHLISFCDDSYYFCNFREILGRKNDVVWSTLSGYQKLPCHNIVPPTGEMLVVATGPGEGVKNISLEPGSPSKKVEWKKNKNSDGKFVPFGEWTKRHPRAYGIGTSMYECDPVANIIMGCLLYTSPSPRDA